MDDTLVEVANVSKNYGKKKEVLRDVSFTVSPGQIVGLLGPNGSGKSTLIKTMVGLLQDYKGIIRIDKNPPNFYTKSIISYLPERTYLSKWMKIKDAVSLFKSFYEDFEEEKAKELLKRMNLNPEDKIRTMSKGMQEKLQLLLVMSRKARLYILDEPLGGVDPAARDTILDTILKNYAEDSAILLSTHLIQDVERIFDKVLFLKDGKMIIDENVDVLREKHNKSIDELFREVYQTCWES